MAVPEQDLHIVLLSIELVIPWARSLKDKRSAVAGLKNRLRARFNASVAEVQYQDKWQRTVIAVCMLGAERPRLESELARIRQLCAEARDLQLVRVTQQWL